MNRGYFKWIVLAAIACLFVVGLFMWREKIKQEEPKHEKIVPRPFAPFTSYIAAVGIVEASSGNIFIGSPINRIVEKIDVQVGQKVKAGDILFQLDAHDLEADLFTRNVEYENALANLKRLESFPRAEDLAVAEAQLQSADAVQKQAEFQYKMVEGLNESGAMSLEEINQRFSNLEIAKAKYQQAQADYLKIKAGTWLPDLTIARLQVKQAEAAVQRVKTDIDRTIIRSPTAATILQIKIHEGEYPPTDFSRTPPMIIGDTNFMHLRVSINQFDASYFNPKAKAVAYVQGNSQIEFRLTFVELEPYFVSKQNLNNDITEQVDTRVLQAIYCFDEGEERVFVGQQMDVFIETDFEDKEKK